MPLYNHVTLFVTVTGEVLRDLEGDKNVIQPDDTAELIQRTSARVGSLGDHPDDPDHEKEHR